MRARARHLRVASIASPYPRSPPQTQQQQNPFNAMPPRQPPSSSLRTLSRHFKSPNLREPYLPRRHQSTSTPPPSSQARIDRVLDRLPKFLHPWTSGLRNAPVSHITSFLLLHELTAVVPLIGLATLFHYTTWLPQSFAEAKWISQGVEKFGRYFGRKGWFGFEREDKSVSKEVNIGDSDAAIGEKEREAGIEKRWHVGERGSRILVEVATAYAITKVLLPARIVLSVWGTPWFARAVVGRFWGLFGNGKAMDKVVKATKKAS